MDDIATMPTALTISKDSSCSEEAVGQAPASSSVQARRRTRTAFKPWLMKVTRNGCLDRLRRRRENVEFNEGHMAGEASGPLQDVSANELGGWLKRAIEGLKEPYRSLVVLRDVQQHSYEEVAGMLELSLAQVKVYLHRARKELREQLAEVRP